MSVAYSFARLHKIGDLSELSRAASHGRRLDPSAAKRVTRERTAKNVAFSIYAPDDPLDLVGAWRMALAASGAETYRGAAIAAHLLVGLSPSVIDEAGDRHDPCNPMNRKLVVEAAAWAEDVFGLGSVFAGRLDVDEYGAGILDLFVMPVREAKMNRSSSKRIVSVAKALEEVHRAHPDDETSYGALQTSWSIWAKRIDTRIVRGVLKAVTARHHVDADVYRYVASTREAEIQAKSAELREAQSLVELEQDLLFFEARGLAQEFSHLVDLRAELDEHGEALERYHLELDRYGEDTGRRMGTEMKDCIGALLDGRIREVDEIGRVHLRPDLPPRERAELTANLRSNWSWGLRDLLLHLRDLGQFGGGPQGPAAAPAPR